MITYKELEKLLPEVAKTVEDLTGWNANLDSVNIAIVKNPEDIAGYNEQGRKILGICNEDISEKIRKEIERDNVYSCYLMTGYFNILDLIVILPENIGCSVDGIRTLLAHEFVHRCQFLNNPSFNENCHLIEKMYMQGESIKKYLFALNCISEGDAEFIESQFISLSKGTNYYPSERVISFLHKVELRRLGKEYIEDLKLSESYYRKGKEFMEKMYSIHKAKRKDINALFNLSPEKLFEIVSRVIDIPGLSEFNYFTDVFV